MLREIPKFDTKQLESILSVLSEPSEVKIGLVGNMTKLAPLTELSASLGLTNRLGYSHDTEYVLKDASKKDIVKLVREQEQRKKAQQEVNEEYNRRAMQHGPSERPPEYADLKSPFSTGIYAYFSEASWHGEGTRITLTPHSINIQYSSKEPAYVAKLRKVLSNDKILKTEIKIDRSAWPHLKMGRPRGKSK